LTKLYHHDPLRTVAVGSLPTTSQSALGAPTSPVDAVTVNRAMDTDKGRLQISKSLSATSGNTKQYFTRFVSPGLNQTSIAANTWNFAFACNTNIATSNFPVTADLGTQVHVTVYVWRPSTGAKVADIFDGTSSGTTFAEPSALSTIKSEFGTFTGSAVTCQIGDVICQEIYFSCAPTQAATNLYYYDGTTETNNTNTTVTNHASYIETPETLSFVTSQTKLYFHAANSGLSNLPTTEQSTLTKTNNVDALTVNRSMDTVKGSAVASLSFNLIATGAQNNYYGRFVSPLLLTDVFGTTINANTWDYCFGFNESGSADNFPCTGANQSVYVNCYVWETANGTKLGTILDGNSDNNFDEDPGTGGNNLFDRGTFKGAAVSSITNTCVIVMEIWFVVSPTTTADVDAFKYDGTVDTTADMGTQASPASFIGTPQRLAFSGFGTPQTVLIEWEEA